MAAIYQTSAMNDTDKKPSGKKPEKPTLEEKKEVGGPKGPEPTRYGDWEVAGRCTDF